MKKCYTLTLLCLIFVVTAGAQTRYWVGPSTGSEAVWNNTTYWSATSGGPGGASVPDGPSYDVIFDQGAMVNVNLTPITLNSLKVTNNSTAVLYTGANTSITLNSSNVANPALDIDAGSTLRDSITANVTSNLIMASNARAEIDGDFRMGSNLNGTVVFNVLNPGVVVNVNATGRIIFGTAAIISASTNIADPHTLFFNAGSHLIIDRNSGLVPRADYNTTSTVRIIGTTNSVPSLSNSAPPTLGNLEFDTPNLNIPGVTTNSLIPNGTVIKGNLRILNTNNEKLLLAFSTGGGSYAATVQGNMEVSGNSQVVLANNNNKDISLQVDGNLIQSGGTISLQENNTTAFVTKLFVRGNITQTSGNFTVSSTATNPANNLFVLELNGTSNQNISFSSGTIDNSASQVALRINNPAGATLLTPLAVGRMDFANGILTTSTGSPLIINNTSSSGFVINGVSDNSHVNGPVRRRTIEAAAYAFPTGKGGNYRVIEVIPSTATLSEYLAEYFNSNHPDPDVVPPLTGRSTDEYWDINRISGTDAAIRLTLEGAVPGANLSHSLLVARFNGGAWQSERGSTGTTLPGNSTSGTVTSQEQSNFGPYTFGFGPSGALPIKLTAFDAAKASGYNNIHWKAECTSTQAVFEIERSTDGQNFQKIETIVADQQRCLQPFDYQDKTATAGVNYYRMRVVDVDGKAYYSRIVAVINKAKGFELVGIYPSLVTTGQLKVNITAANRDKAELYVTNMNGQVIRRMQVTVNPGENVINLNVEDLSAGIYHVTGKNNEGETKTLRFVKQ